MILYFFIGCFVFCICYRGIIFSGINCIVRVVVAVFYWDGVGVKVIVWDYVVRQVVMGVNMGLDIIGIVCCKFSGCINNECRYDGDVFSSKVM